MFNVGGMELVVIGLVALVVLGPDKLPGALRQMGSVIGEVRRISQGFRTDLQSALDDAERQAESEKRAAAAATAAAPAQAPGAPDPKAAMEAARRELDAIEAREPSPAPEPRATEPRPGPSGRADRTESPRVAPTTTRRRREPLRSPTRPETDD